MIKELKHIQTKNKKQITNRQREKGRERERKKKGEEQKRTEKRYIERTWKTIHNSKRRHEHKTENRTLNLSYYTGSNSLTLNLCCVGTTTSPSRKITHRFPMVHRYRQITLVTSCVPEKERGSGLNTHIYTHTQTYSNGKSKNKRVNLYKPYAIHLQEAPKA